MVSQFYELKKKLIHPKFQFKDPVG
jgi:hypothetical protein